MAELVLLEGEKEVERFAVEDGTSVMHGLLHHGIDVEHACGGYCACSTCHVYIDEGMDNLSEQSDDEFDRLDRAKGVNLKSRLSCQAKLLGGCVKVRIP